MELKPLKSFVGQVARIVDWKWHFSKATQILMMRLWLRFDEKHKFVVDVYSEHEPYMYIWTKDKKRFLKQVGREGRVLIKRAEQVKNFNFDGYRVFVNIPSDVATLKSFFAICKICNKVKHVSIESKRAFCKCGSTVHRVLDIYFPSSDVVYEKRWAVDKKIRTFVVLVSVDPNRVKRLDFDPNNPNLSLPALKRLYWDIETKGLDPTKLSALITACSFALNAKKVGFMGIKIKGKSSQENEGFKFPNEGNLIGSMWKRIQTCDELLGFNSDSFDWPYLVERADLWKNKSNKFPYVPENPLGFSRVDIQHEWIAMRRLTRRTTPYTSLNDVLKAEGLGSKVDIGESNPEKIRKLEPQKFKKYTRKDSQVLPLIAKKTGVIDTLERRATKQGVPIKNALKTYYGLDTYILREVERMGDITAPSARHIDQLNQEARRYMQDGTLHPEIYAMWMSLRKFPGAYVWEPEVGMHNVIAICDFVSLYNRIMQTFNISFETVAPVDMVDYDIIRRNKQVIKVPKPSDKVLVSPRPLSYDSAKMKRTLYFDAPFHIAFRKDRRGVVPYCLEDNEKSREAAQLKMYSFEKDSTDYNKYDGVQRTEKGFILSYYGVMGLIYGRYFDLRTASAVTLAGQALIIASAEEIEGPISDKLVAEGLIMGPLKIVYGDTDSVFIKMLVRNYEMAMDVSRRINELLIDFYVRYLDKLGVPRKWQVIEMKIEKILAPIVFPRGASKRDPKKRYFGLIIAEEGLNEKGEKDIVRTYIEKITDYREIMDKIYDTGLETKKSNYCKFAKEVQKEVQALICLRKKLDEIEDHLIVRLDEMRTGKYDSDLVIGTKITQPLSSYQMSIPHVRAAEKAKDKGAVIYPGDVQLFVYAGQDVEPVMRTGSDELIVPENINYRYYEETQIKKPINRMLDAVFLSQVEPTSTLQEWM